MFKSAGPCIQLIRYRLQPHMLTNIYIDSSVLKQNLFSCNCSKWLAGVAIPPNNMTLAVFMMLELSLPSYRRNVTKHFTVVIYEKVS